MKRKAALVAIRRLHNLPDDQSESEDTCENSDISDNESTHIEDPTFDCDHSDDCDDDDLVSDNEDVDPTSPRESSSEDEQPLRERLAMSGPESILFDINQSDPRGRDGTIWTEISSTNTAVQTALHNIMRISPGPSSYASSRVISGSPLSVWKLLFDETILRNIRRCTIAEARRQKATDWDVSLKDLEKTFGLLYAKGLFMSSKTPVRLLWSDKWAPPLFARTMPRDRFYSIMKYLRFDEKQERSERLRQDRFALASDLWTPFIENCAKCFNGYENLTIDEQLMPCKCRCKFIQYMANKPDKFGLKFFLLVDLKTKYVLNAIPYLGRFEDRPQEEGLALHVIKKLSNPILNKGHNITADNYFSSLEVARYLKRQRTSYLGTIRSNRRELPNINEIMKGENVYGSRFFSCKDNASLTLYKVRKNKTVSLLSTLHQSPSIPSPESEKRKPDVVLHYNQTKCGVDCFDSMARMYTTRCTSRRWPLYVLYNVLDICAINSWTLYKEVTKINISRRDFHFELIQELIQECLTDPGQPFAGPSTSRRTASKRRHCSETSCQNKTATVCSSCDKHCCGLHTYEKVTIVKCNRCCE